MPTSASGRRSEDKGAAQGRQESSAAEGPFSPAGLKVLVVDDDQMCLKVVSAMLQRCNYQVETQSSGQEALALLRARQEGGSDQFDLVLSDVYMPDMDGFRLLEHIGLELELPVIMMSSDGDTSVVLRGVTHGAVDFLIKPVRIEELRNVWQHVVRRRAASGEPHAHAAALAAADGDVDSRAHGSKRKGDSRDDLELLRADHEGGAGGKKARVVWSVEMHQQFVAAVNVLGVDKAVPKRILDLMNVEGLTRENVASHLQKYRLALQKYRSGAPAGGGCKAARGAAVPAPAAMPAVTASFPAASAADTEAVGSAKAAAAAIHRQHTAAAAAIPRGPAPVTMMGMPAPMTPANVAAWQQHTMAMQAGSGAGPTTGGVGAPPGPHFMPPGPMMPPGYPVLPLLPPPPMHAGHGSPAMGGMFGGGQAHGVRYPVQYAYCAPAMPPPRLAPTSSAPSFASNGSGSAQPSTTRGHGGADGGCHGSTGQTGSSGEGGGPPHRHPPASPSLDRSQAFVPGSGEGADALLPNLAEGGGGGSGGALAESSLGDSLLPDMSSLPPGGAHNHTDSFLDLFMLDGGDESGG